MKVGAHVQVASVGSGVTVGAGLGSGVGRGVGDGQSARTEPLQFVHVQQDENIPSVLMLVVSQHSTWLKLEAPAKV